MAEERLIDRILDNVRRINESRDQAAGDPSPSRIRRHRKRVLREMAEILPQICEHAEGLSNEEFDVLLQRAAPFLDNLQKSVAELLTQEAITPNSDEAEVVREARG